MSAAAAILAPNGRPARMEIARVRALYEAADNNRLRSSIPSPVQGVNRDLSRQTRRELLRKSRHWWQNSPHYYGMMERIVVLTIGQGIVPIAASADKEWNRRANTAWKGWAKVADLSSRSTFYDLQQIAFRGIVVDGEGFTLLTQGESNRPRLQQFQAHRVQADNYSGKADDPDGIAVDANGRPVSYRITLTDDRSGPATSRDADSVIHHFFPLMADQRRGVPLTAPATNHIHDLEDVIGLEKIAVKQASSKTDIIKTASGEINPEDVQVAGGLESLDANNEESRAYYEEVFGPESKVLRHGDEYTPYVPSRPGPAWSGFVEWLANVIAHATGLPPSVLVNFKIGGADSRRDLATAQRVIDVWQGKLIAQFQRVWEYVIGYDIDAGYLPGAPADWREVAWQVPRVVTVDYGREAQQDREDVRAGLLTRQEYWARYGLDPEQQDDQVLAEVLKRKQDIEGSGLTVEQFITLLRLDPVKQPATPLAQAA